MPADRRVVIWRSALLPASETFVRNHGAALTRWRPAYLGATRIASPLADPADVVAFPDGDGFLRLRLTGSSPVLTEALRRLGPDVVHAHFGGDGWLVGRAAAACGAPLVITVHGHDVTRQPLTPGPLGLRYRRNLRAAFRRAAVILAVSEPIRERAIALGAEPAKVRVHHTGIPIPAAFPGGPKRWDVAFVGRLVEKKGTAYLLEAVRQLGPGWSLKIVGDGPLRAALEATAAGIGDGTQIEFVGTLGRKDLAAAYAESSIVVFPSVPAASGDQDGLCVALLEAMCVGSAVISSRMPGADIAIEDGVSGMLVPPGDVAALAAAMAKLLEDPGLRDQFGAAARARADTFSVQAIGAKYRELLQQILAGDERPCVQSPATTSA